MPTIAAGLYLRISQDKTGDELGIARQREQCTELAKRKGWKIVDEYSDPSVSASKSYVRRPEFERLREDITRRRLDAVVCWDLDRLTRQPIEIEWIIDRAEADGLLLASVGDDYDLSSPNGRMFARIKAATARSEIEFKSRRHEAAIRQAVKMGRSAGGPRAFGYTHDKNHLDPIEAPLLAEAYRRWNIGATLGELCRWLNAEGVTTPKGNVWTLGSMRAVLANPRNAGLRGVRWTLTDERGRPVRDDRGRPLRERYHVIEGKAVWPGVVDEPTWRQAVERFKDPARRTNYNGRDRKYLLAGIATCAECGAKAKTHFANKHQSGGDGRSIACVNGCCNRRASPIEAYITELALQRLEAPDAIMLLAPNRPGVDVAALRDESQAIRDRMAELARDEVLGRRTRAEVAAAREAASERLAEIDETLTSSGRGDVLDEFVAPGADPRQRWEEATLAIKQKVLTALGDIRIGSGAAQPGRPPRGAKPFNVHYIWHRT